MLLKWNSFIYREPTALNSVMKIFTTCTDLYFFLLPFSLSKLNEVEVRVGMVLYFSSEFLAQKLIAQKLMSLLSWESTLDWVLQNSSKLGSVKWSLFYQRHFLTCEPCVWGIGLNLMAFERKGGYKPSVSLMVSAIWVPFGEHFNSHFFSLAVFMLPCTLL